MAFEGVGSLVIRRICGDIEQVGHDFPEGVAGVCIVLVCLQGRDTGHAAEDEDFGVGCSNGRETLAVLAGLHELPSLAGICAHGVGVV